MSEAERTPSARIDASGWGRWIWLLPVAVAGVLIWLVLRTWAFGGPSVTVSFPTSAGMKAGAPVTYRDVEVGRVSRVRFSADHSRVVLDLAMQSRVRDLLREQTHFWIVRPSLASGELTGLISGPRLAMDPGPGEPARRFEGLELPPRVERWQAGRAFDLTTEDPGALSIGSPVLYRNTPIGRVRGVSLADAHSVEVAIFVRKEFEHLVRESSRFWRGGRLSIRTRGAAPGIDLPSMGTLMSGAVFVETPRVLAGPAAKPGRRFTLHATRQGALAAPGGARFEYQVRYPRAVGGLQQGTPVELEGVTIGHVAQSHLEYDPENRALATRVRLVVDARALGLQVAGSDSRSDVGVALNQALAQLVAQGRRVRPSGGLLPGSRALALARLQSSPPARLVTRTVPPVLPAAPGGGGIGPAVDSLTRLADRVEALPLDDIAGHIQQAAARVDELVSDPALERSITRLADTLASVERTAATVEDSAEPLIESLRQAAQSTERVARDAERFLGGPVRQNQDLAALIEELNDAARAVSDLASYLARQPEALVTGKN